ncbi:lipopolysaccharide biosynthesis protein [Sphingomonas jaspsi]|uniref:lipopolysaccharide biosynthesis protein n=1 Tax=Sphingomonas jaspsi TaxID=392409 RepID=UPI0006841456|nr:lipopolysaccharide biosynthesis protein [Sphingomonas jaspsi]
MAALARGGRLNFLGFVIRLIARLPFLFIAGRSYGPEALGRFAYAVLVVELAAQLSTLGLKRGLAQLLATTDKPHACVVADAMLVTLIGSAVSMAVLMSFPVAMFPNSQVHGLDWALPVTVLAVAWTDIALAALAYRHDVGATVRARSVVEPWAISIVAFIWSYISLRDGLIISYVVSMLAALVAALIPLVRSYGIPHGWSPDWGLAWKTTRRYLPLAAADAVEWGSRRVDIAVLGLFLSPAYVGIYYVAQQVATLPAKLKTSFEPVLGPAIARGVAAKDYSTVAKQVRQVGFWILGAQAGIALALGIPGRAVMALVGDKFTGGTATLAFLLAAEVAAATAVVSEAALIYLARHKNMIISLTMLAIEAALSALLIVLMRDAGWPTAWVATGPAAALAISLGFASIMKSNLLHRKLKEAVTGWRWTLLWSAAAAIAVGIPVRLYLPEFYQLVVGIPVILGAFCAVLWFKGFGPEDRELFKMRKSDIAEMQLPPPGSAGDAPV